ncbi:MULTISPECIES: type I secretion system permease/ATPase [Falsihalocynthiibacter]|uniref:type I secretion system permease/ATPase n=1 Tax=Falsihalocynthiibacter TaxID=2854182 RepID=UPI00300302F9
MQKQFTDLGREELNAAQRQNRPLIWAMILFSIFVNLLMLTGPLFMLQIYDRVLSSRSVETLIALSILATFLYFCMGVLDFTRGRIMARAGARFQASLNKRVFSAVLRANTVPQLQKNANTALQDVDAVQSFISSPIFIAFVDLPWTPLFIATIFLFHPWLGILAVTGGAFLMVVAFFNQISTKAPVLSAGLAARRADLQAQEIRFEAETIQSLGMREAAFERWRSTRESALEFTLTASDRVGGFSTTTKTFRQFLQSAMLALGAYLVLQNELSAGAMIAGSILLGRALQPVEQAIGGWAYVVRAKQGWRSLSELLSAIPPEEPRTTLPPPSAKLDVQQVTVVPPGDSQAALRMVSFSLPAGTALGVIGSSGSGKSTLARALTGVWRLAGGTIRLDNASLEQYDPDVLGKYIGYLPQKVQLFEGTVAQNIGRLSQDINDDKVVAAAKKAAAHEMILTLPQGYDTQVSGAGGRLSGGQIQRIGLARAFYDDPVLLVLDEPNSNLDNVGSEALNHAIRAAKSAGNSVIIMAHRPAAIRECDLLLIMENGSVKAFGPKNEILQQNVTNHNQISQDQGAGGVT